MDEKLLHVIWAAYYWLAVLWQLCMHQCWYKKLEAECVNIQLLLCRFSYEELVLYNISGKF